MPLAFGAATGGGIGFDYQREHFTNTDAFSLFGSVDFDISDQLTLTAGVRWTDEEKDNRISCLLYTSPSPRDLSTSRMPSSA